MGLARVSGETRVASTASCDACHKKGQAVGNDFDAPVVSDGHIHIHVDIGRHSRQTRGMVIFFGLHTPFSATRKVSRAKAAAAEGRVQRSQPLPKRPPEQAPR